MPLTLTLDGTPVDVELRARHPHLVARIDGRDYELSEAAAFGEECWLLTVNDRQYQVWRVCEGERVHLKIGTRSFSVGVTDPLDGTRHGTSGDELRADMPGVVVALRCQVGDPVTVGDPLLTIESMKMQITLHAPRDGVVAATHVAVNQPFQKGALLIALEKFSEASSA